MAPDLSVEELDRQRREAYDQTVTSTTADQTGEVKVYTNPGPSPVELAVKAELQEHLRLAKQYQEMIETAKTEFKKKFYRKKLQKNNAKAFQMLVALERIKAGKKL